MASDMSDGSPTWLQSLITRSDLLLNFASELPLVLTEGLGHPVDMLRLCSNGPNVSTHLYLQIVVTTAFGTISCPP